jgi:hypothetical protein
MRTFRQRLHGCTWLAMLAMLTLALGPTVSRLTLPEEPSHGEAIAFEVPIDHAAMPQAAMNRVAMHAHQHDPAAMVATKTPALPAQPAHHHTLEHCALCAVAASAFPVAASPPVIIAVATLRRDIAVLVERGPAPGRTPWSPATSRGPPARA